MVLSWHVDYWDYIGWKDPFGSKAYSQRQTRYVKALKLKGRWTPMLLVDNHPIRATQFEQAIAKARKKKAMFDAVVSASLKGGTIEGSVKFRLVNTKWSLGKDVVVQPVLFQKRAKTACKAGENKGKTLDEFFVVRAAPEPLDRGAAFAKGARISVSVPKGVKADNLGLAILLEDTVKMQTLGCWWVPISSG